jgi:hypothetical protein
MVVHTVSSRELNQDVGPAMSLLRLIEKEPEAVRRALILNH